MTKPDIELTIPAGRVGPLDRLPEPKPLHLDPRGRKPKQPEDRVQARNVCLYRNEWDRLRELGAGNVSAGIRAAIEATKPRD